VRSGPYHHGDLRAALIDEGLRAARTGGVGALALRELTRAVGVSPNAVYRHFADRQALVVAVAVAAQDLLARAMHDRLDAVDPDTSPATAAIARLRAVGIGYIEFARAEPGWFELAYLTHDDRGPVSTAARVPPPYQLLLDALDGLVSAGVLTVEQRTHAEWACWSSVHGFADLATRGPLRHQDLATVDALAAYVVDTAIRGLTATHRPEEPTMTATGQLDATFTVPILVDGAFPTYIELPGSQDLLGTRKAVKVSGTIDGHPFDATLMPSGRGPHWLPVRAALRKTVGKEPGAEVTVRLTARR
jgi:AcrR family transcriptional regulator